MNIFFCIFFVVVVVVFRVMHFRVNETWCGFLLLLGVVFPFVNILVMYNN